MRKFQPANHIKNLLEDSHYLDLIQLRNDIGVAIDAYFQNLKAPKVDLYMVTSSVSSPTGKGSDSEPWPIQMGGVSTHLVDSAQFGMEPLVQGRYNCVYCYLPSFRGEDPDDHHLNQFYHVESEIAGDLEECIELAEGMLHQIGDYLKSDEAKKLIDNSRLALINQLIEPSYERITFDEACEILNNDPKYIKENSYGRTITREGESVLSDIKFKGKKIFWITHFDRDTVPFYQKPDPNNKDKILNTDLILPRIDGKGFFGEVLGLGQRQDNVAEIQESIDRQEVHNPDSYKWYIDLRRNENYKQTSGFGMGMERLLSWVVGTDDIASVAIYPVMNSVTTEY